jgi:dihydropyrimidinase
VWIPEHAPNAGTADQSENVPSPCGQAGHTAIAAFHLQVNTGKLSYESFVRVTSTEAAKVFNIYPRKGAVLPGSDADIIVFDPARRHTISAATHHSAMDTNVYEGMVITGKARPNCAASLAFAWCSDATSFVISREAACLPIAARPGQ